MLLSLVVCLPLQYIEPAVSHSILPLSQSDYVRVAERVLKLALPNLYCWLCMFYCLFHLWLNILGEVSRGSQIPDWPQATLHC